MMFTNFIIWNKQILYVFYSKVASDVIINLLRIITQLRTHINSFMIKTKENTFRYTRASEKKLLLNLLQIKELLDLPQTVMGLYNR